MPRVALALSGAALLLSACSAPVPPERLAEERARAAQGVEIFRRGCIATNATARQAIAYFRSQGMTENMPNLSNTTGVYARDLSRGGRVLTFSLPGSDGRGCSVVIDGVSSQVAAAAYYGFVRQHYGNDGKTNARAPVGIVAAGGLPRFKADGTFESVAFYSGANSDTGNPAFVLSFVTGRTSLPLAKLENGMLFPTPQQIETKSP